MAEFEVVIAHLPHLVADRDVEALGLRVLLDSAYFQYIEVWVTGQDSRLAHPDVFNEPKFWSALAVHVCPIIENLVDDGNLPTAQPDRARVINAIDFDAVGERARRGAVPDLVVGEVVWQFER